MVVSYVLINTSPKKEHNVYNSLREFEKISEVHPLFGSYDMIIKIDIDDPSEMGKLIDEKIRSVDGIIHTETLKGKPL